MKTKYILLAILLCLSVAMQAQVTIGDDEAPQSFSALELISNQKMGLRMPQLTTAQRDVMTATTEFQNEKEDLAKGLMIYNTTINCLEFWNGERWISRCDGTVMGPDPIDCFTPCDCDGDGFLDAGCGGTDPDDNDPCIPAVTGLVSTVNPAGSVTVGTTVAVTVTTTGSVAINNLSLDGGATRVNGNTITVTPTAVGANTFTITVNNCPSQTVEVTITATACTPITSAAVSICIPYMFTYQTMNLTATQTGGGPATSYQWYVDGEAVKGATNATFAYTPGTDGLTDKLGLGNMTKDAKIKCDISNACGTVTSNEGSILVVQAEMGQLSPIYIWEEINTGAGIVKQRIAFAHVNLGAEYIIDPCNMASDYYQWGRPKDGHQFYDSNITDVLSPVAPPGHADFILTPKIPYNWLTFNDKTLWGDGTQGYNQAKGEYDPCPAGWKVPSQKQWTATFRHDADNIEYATSATANTWKWLGGIGGDLVGDALFLPAYGARNNYDDAPYVNKGTQCYYWSSTVFPSTPGDSYVMRVYSTQIMTDGYQNRSFGMPVRCIQEVADNPMVLCDSNNPNFNRNGAIIYPEMPLTTQTVVVTITNDSPVAISGSITATGGGMTFTGTVSIAAKTTADVTMTGSGQTTIDQQGKDVPMTWNTTGFALYNSSGTPFGANFDLCGFTVPVGLGEARILFADNDNNGIQTWGPGGVSSPSTRSLAIIGDVTSWDTAPAGSTNFGTTTGVAPYIPVKFVPYNAGEIVDGGYTLRANNAGDAGQISAAIINPDIPNPNVLIYATENWDDNMAPAVSGMVSSGGWIIYTTKNANIDADGLGNMLTAAGLNVTSANTGALVDIPATLTPAAGSAAYKILNGPFGNVSGQTIVFDDGNANLAGIAGTLPANCEAILPPVNGYNVCFVYTNPTTKGGVIVLGKNMGADTAAATNTPAVYNATTHKPVSANAILEMNALAFALEQSVMNDVDDK